MELLEIINFRFKRASHASINYTGLWEPQRCICFIIHVPHQQGHWIKASSIEPALIDHWLQHHGDVSSLKTLKAPLLSHVFVHAGLMSSSPATYLTTSSNIKFSKKHYCTVLAITSLWPSAVSQLVTFALFWGHEVLKVSVAIDANEWCRRLTRKLASQALTGPKSMSTILTRFIQQDNLYILKPLLRFL